LIISVALLAYFYFISPNALYRNNVNKRRRRRDSEVKRW